MHNNANIKQQRRESRVKKVLYEFFSFSSSVDGELKSLIITRVHISRDGRTGTLFFIRDKEMPTQDWIKSIIDRYNTVRVEMQNWLSENMKLKFVPKFTFKFDKDYLNFVRVENIIDEIGKENDQKDI